MRRFVGTIGVRQFTREESRRIREAIGSIQPRDHGKRVYDMGDGVYQVENDEQRQRREAPNHSPACNIGNPAYGFPSEAHMNCTCGAIRSPGDGSVRS